MYNILFLVLFFSICSLRLQADMVYVGSETNGVTVINTVSNTVIATLDTLGSRTELALTPNHQFVYIASGSFVYVLDTSSNSVIATIDGFSQAGPIIANDAFVYVGDQDTTTLYAIDISSNTIVASFPGAAGNSKMGITADGQLLYSSTASLDQVAVIDTQSNTIVATIQTSISDRVNNFTTHQRAYLVSLDGEVSVVDTTTNTVIAILNVSQAKWAAVTPQGLLYVVGFSSADVIGDNNQIITSVSLGIDSAEFAISRPDGQFVYVAGENGISIIDTSTQELVDTIYTDSAVSWIVSSPDGQFLYAALTYENRVIALDAQENTIVGSFPVQSNPSHLAYLPRAGDRDSSPFSLSPASSPSGRQVKQRFFTHSDLVNIITWAAPTGFTPVIYNLYRDSLQTDLAGSVSGHQLEFQDHKRVKRQFYTYYLVAVDVDGNTLDMGVIRVAPIL